MMNINVHINLSPAVKLPGNQDFDTSGCLLCMREPIARWGYPQKQGAPHDHPKSLCGAEPKAWAKISDAEILLFFHVRDLDLKSSYLVLSQPLAISDRAS